MEEECELVINVSVSISRIILINLLYLFNLFFFYIKDSNDQNSHSSLINQLYLTYNDDHTSNNSVAELVVKLIWL